MSARIARRQLVRALAIDVVAFPLIVLVLLTQPTPARLIEAVVILLASSSFQAVLLVQGAREARALQWASALAQPIDSRARRRGPRARHTRIL